MTLTELKKWCDEIEAHPGASFSTTMVIKDAKGETIGVMVPPKRYQEFDQFENALANLAHLLARAGKLAHTWELPE